jgi:hypothetical protein
MAPSTITLSIQCCYAECHIFYCKAECHYFERHYVKCHFAECWCDDCHYAECWYAEYNALHQLWIKE